MADIQQFTEHILNKKREECEKELSAVMRKEQDKLQQEILLIEEQERLAIEKIDADAQLDYTIQKQKIANEKRNRILAYRQKQLDSIFNKAEQKMLNWSQSEFQQFLYGVCATLESEHLYTLKLGEHTQFSLQNSDKTLQELLQNKTNDMIQLPKFVSLSSEIIPNQSGFILERAGIEYNYLFSALIQELKQDYSGELSQQLVR